MPDPRSQYRWNAAAARYVDARGRFVSRPEVRGAIDTTLDRAAARIQAHAVALREGRLSLAEWQLAMRAEMKAMHLWSAAAARGGWAQMSAADFGRIGPVLRNQYGYLARFALQIEQGLPLDGRFVRRALMYAQAARATYHAQDELVHRERGFDQERNVIEPSAENCDGCRSESRRGWVPLGKLVPIGGRECRTNCRCLVEYRRAEGGATA